MTNNEKLKEVFGYGYKDIAMCRSVDWGDQEYKPPENNTNEPRWEEIRGNGIIWYRCSKCHQKPLRDNFLIVCFSPFCPNCGTKMNNEVKE